MGSCLQQGCLLWLLVEGKKETHFTLSTLPLTSFCRSENENTERLSNISSVAQLGSGRTREASSTSHLWPWRNTWLCFLDWWLLLCGVILFYMTWGLTWMLCVILSGDKPRIHSFLHVLIQMKRWCVSYWGNMTGKTGGRSGPSPAGDNTSGWGPSPLLPVQSCLFSELESSD